MNQKNDLYSEEYQEQLKQHHDSHHWGGAVVGKIPEILFFMELMEVNDVLDYGCGRGDFKNIVESKLGNKYEIYEYEPGIKEKTDKPNPANMVICIDVLEHIEPELIDNVLDDLQRLVKKIGYFTICLAKALQYLPDGRNAHLIVEPREWWKSKLQSRFKIINEQGNESYYKVIVKKNV